MQPEDLLPEPTFPLQGFVEAKSVVLNDFVDDPLGGYRVTFAVTYDDGTVLLQGVRPAGGHVSIGYPGDRVLSVTRLVDENLEPS